MQSRPVLREPRLQGMFGWEWLDLYPLAWLAALVIAYRPVFTTPRRQSA